MNVDLNWCPCGKQCREDKMYCSDACYLKDLASNNNLFTRGKYFEKDSFFTRGGYEKSFNNPMKTTMSTAYNKIPEIKDLILTTANNLTFKNRKKHQLNLYTGNHPHFHSHGHHHGYSHSSYTSILSTSSESSTSTIDDYFKGQSLTKLDNSNPKQSESVLVPPKTNENVKEKTEAKSYSSRSSYVIEAVYPVQNFTKNTITVY